MTLFLTIIAFLVIFSVLILVHEAGHYFAALRTGVKVEEFGFGLPPRIWGHKSKKSGTIFSLNAIPFGGFVRLYGEDKMDTKALKDPKSFVSKSPWQKIVVVVAGVVMNFLLAYLLLVFGLVIGMQPLITDPQQIYDGINNKTIEVQSGFEVKDVLSDGQGIFEKGDKLVDIDGKKILLGDELGSFVEGKSYQIGLIRNGQYTTVSASYFKNKPWYNLYDSVFLPKVAVHSVETNSIYAQAGLQSEDLISGVNGRQIFDFATLETDFQNSNDLKLDVFRGHQEMTIEIKTQRPAAVTITDVLDGSPAKQAGLLPGDEVLAINGKQIYTVDDLKTILDGKNGQSAQYQILRNGTVSNFSITPDQNGLVGVLLAELSVPKHPGISFYLKSVPYSVTEVDNIQLPWYQAFPRAWDELSNLSVLTVQMFGGVIATIVTKFQVPAGVAGPVGIAQMTYTFVQQGFMSLIRFTALLSLSLAIINILPFPGLDGGRLLLILVSMLIGRKIDPRFEGLIHVIGFLILLLFIFIITFNDILRLFGVI